MARNSFQRGSVVMRKRSDDSEFYILRYRVRDPHKVRLEGKD